MPFKFEEELRTRAELFIRSLTDSGLPIEPYPVMYQDYMVKLAMQGAGYVNIYYSPKKNEFSLKLHELNDKRLAAEVEACWYGGLSDEQVQTACEYQAYVDGSYIDGFVGCGAVILHRNQEIARFSDAVISDVDMRQVAGELAATMYVMDWCQQNEVGEIDIFYDYEGIEKWATGQWRATKPATQEYQAYMRKKTLQVTWHKVKSHAGNRWNDVADELAKQGALSQHEADVPEDPLVKLEHTATSFVAYLVEHDIHASYDQIYNGQYARVIVRGGYFDLYNTRKRPMLPYLHSFKDAELQTEIEHHWRAFFGGSRDEKAVSELSGFEEIEYYLAVFEPYRHLRFDFTALAQVLQPFVEPDELLPIDNYDEIEKIYKRVRNSK